MPQNQIMITALAIMIAVAGYLNFAGTKVTEEEIMTVDSDQQDFGCRFLLCNIRNGNHIVDCFLFLRFRNIGIVDDLHQY